MGREGITVAGTPIAEGVVIVSADAKDVPKQVARDLDSGQNELAAGGNRAGSKLFAGITKFAVGAVATVGTIGVAVGGLALKGGFDRALAIQDSKKKLEGLGHSVESISSIMESALNSVRGTAFGLGAAATTSAGLVAAGVNLGGELERRLKTVADTATIAGRSMEDVGLIFQSVAAKGKLQGDDLLQLMSSGIPVLQFLAKHYGITAEEASEMVSRGEVDFANFADAIEENIGGAALRGGETARGAFANIGAALSRLGEGIAAPVVAGAPRLFGSIADAIDRISNALKPMTNSFSNWITPAMERFSQWLDSVNFQGLLESAKSFSPLLSALEMLKPLLPVLESMGRDIWPVFAGALEEVRTALEPVLPMLGQALVDAVVELAPPLTDLLIALIPLLPAIVKLATEALPPLVDILEIIIPPLADFVQIIADVLEAVTPLLDMLDGNTSFGDIAVQVYEAGGFFTGFADAIEPAISFILDSVENIANGFTWLNDNIIQPFVTGFLTVFGIIAAIVVWWYENVISPVFNGIATVFMWLWNNITVPVMNGIGTALQGVATIFTWLYVNIIQPVFNGIATVFNWIWNTIISPIATFIGNAMQGAGDKSKNAFGGLGDFVGKAFQNALNMVKGPINGIISLVNSAIRGLNKLSITIPDWVPQVGGQTWGLNIPTIPMLAKGGVIRTGGRVMVGERGPEILDLPRGAQVTPLDRPDALPGNDGGGGGDQYVEITINEAEDPLGSADRVAAELRKWRK